MLRGSVWERLAASGNAGIFARDACSKDTKRAHGVSRAKMPALPGKVFALPSFNRGFRFCLVAENASTPLEFLWPRTA
jgi:hypothetical protein